MTRILALLAATLVLFSCGRELPEVDFKRVTTDGAPASPILIVGMDGLEWDVALPLIEKGEMPHLKGLMDRGSYGLLETLKIPASPIIWTTVATGKTPEEHGIEGFIKEDSKDLYLSSDRKTKALWNILSDYKMSSATVGWWITYPVERVNGVMVAQTNTQGTGLWKGTIHDGQKRQVWPSVREKDVFALAGEVNESLADLTREIFGEMEGLTQREQAMWLSSEWSFRADNTYLRVAEALLDESTTRDLTLVYFGGTDVVGHRFWRHAYPEQYDHRPSAESIETLGSVIDDYYRYTDSALGRLLERTDESWTIFVVSDHGMRAENRSSEFAANELAGGHGAGPLRLLGALPPPGVLIAAGPPIKKMGVEAGLSTDKLVEVGSVYDVTPTILNLLRIPTGDDMAGSPMVSLFGDGFEQVERVTVPTHDTRDFLATRPARDDDRARDEERLQQLRDLGYIQ